MIQPVQVGKAIGHLPMLAFETTVSHDQMGLGYRVIC